MVLLKLTFLVCTCTVYVSIIVVSILDTCLQDSKRFITNHAKTTEPMIVTEFYTNSITDRTACSMMGCSRHDTVVCLPVCNSVYRGAQGRCMRVVLHRMYRLATKSAIG